MAKKPAGIPTSWQFEINKDALVQLQIRAEKRTHVSGWVGLILKILFLLLLAVFVIVMGRNALSSHQIVIDAFDLDPGVQPGLSGEMVAQRIRSQLVIMRLNSGSQRGARFEDLRDPNWLEDSQITIPQTGMTLGALTGELRRGLGNDTHIRGEVYRDPDQRDPHQLTLVVRTGDASETYHGANINELVRRAAEWVYMQTDRFHYAVYLSGNRRLGDSDRQLIALATRGADRVARALALAGLGANILDSEGDCPAATLILEEARRLNPAQPTIYGTLSNAYFCLGHDQAAADATAEEMRLLGANPGELDQLQIHKLLLEDQDNRAGNLGNYRSRFGLYDAMEDAGMADQSRRRALAHAELRETSLAQARLRYWYAIWRRNPDILQWRNAYWHVRFTQAWGLGNWSEAATFIQRANSSLAVASDPYARAQLQTQSLPLEAMALARAGESEAAAAIVGRLPEDCYLCSRSRALVADAAGDLLTANRWYRQAVRLARELPFAYSEYGEARLRRGDAFLALGLFDLALQHGPAFVDAHKGRGDSLAALGRHAEAVASYQAAATLAPQWGALHMRWAWALAHLGQVEEARAKTCAAARMDLGLRDRALLNLWVGLARFRC